MFIFLVIYDVNVQPSIDNDANGIGWINLDCLASLITNGNITVNKHCRIVLKKLLNIELPHCDFIKIKNYFL